MIPPTVNAPAKINVHLRVFPPENGFHPLRSWFRTVDLFDTLSLETGRRGAAHTRGCSIACDDPTVPRGDDNLICRADAALRGSESEPGELDHWKSPRRYRLVKRIPSGGGLGGGSSDAAATLALREFGNPPLGLADASRARYAAIAAELGSDVPFFLSHQFDGTTDATCTGRGEIVEPFTPGRRHAVLLILPGLHVATPAVFKKFDELPATMTDGQPDFAAWSMLPAIELLPLLRNDLEAATFALHPSLGELRAECEQRLGRPVRMTGSGSTLFSLYDDPAEAAEVISRLDVRSIVG